MKETRVALKILNYVKYGNLEQRTFLLKECNELAAIIATMIKNNREKLWLKYKCKQFKSQTQIQTQIQISLWKFWDSALSWDFEKYLRGKSKYYERKFVTFGFIWIWSCVCVWIWNMLLL